MTHAVWRPGVKIDNRGDLRLMTAPIFFLSSMMRSHSSRFHQDFVGLLGEPLLGPRITVRHIELHLFGDRSSSPVLYYIFIGRI